jgi:hypothetical protein
MTTGNDADKYIVINDIMFWKTRQSDPATGRTPPPRHVAGNFGGLPTTYARSHQRPELDALPHGARTPLIELVHHSELFSGWSVCRAGGGVTVGSWHQVTECDHPRGKDRRTRIHTDVIASVSGITFNLDKSTKEIHRWL